MPIVTTTRECDVLLSLIAAACRALAAEGRMVEGAAAVSTFAERITAERATLEQAEALAQARQAVAQADTESTHQEP